MRVRHLYLLTPLLLANAPLSAAPITQGAPAAVPPDRFRIMTEREIDEHRRTMAGLSGTAREDYRNAQYRLLKQRAQAQGYLLPDTPPWGHTQVLPAVSPQPDMAALVERQRQVVEQALQQQSATPLPTVADDKGGDVAPVQTGASDKVSEAAPASKTADDDTRTATTTPEAQTEAAANAAGTTDKAATDTEASASASAAAQSPTDERYRQLMRQRFDAFMQQREVRQSELDQQRQQEQAELQARRDAHQAEVESRRQAMLRQPQTPAFAPPAPMPYAPTPMPYGYAYPPPVYYPPQY